jgi:chemotaxis protein CheZ
MGAGVQRRTFRVEQMLGVRRAAAPMPREADMPQTDFARELTLMREALARHKRDLMALQRDGSEPRMARAAYELGAAVDGMEKATQKILKSSEAIDESVKTLAATLKTGFEHGLAQEIQEQTVCIYEACNFQDLAGQRIGKALAALNEIEAQVQRMIALCDSPGQASPSKADASMKHHAEPKLVNGPRLDGDSGHANQRDIDALFG